MNSGLQELGLALFTTLAPSSIIAVAVVAFALLFIPIQDTRWTRLAHRIIVLLLGALIGFLASATQLGSPDNALFVFTGIGRSPLSNEVTSVVLFLGMAGLFWIASFFNIPNALRKLWAALIVAGACISATMIALAYSAPTILTWDSAFGPINLILSALVGGLAIGGLYLRLNCPESFARCQKALCAFAAAALLANIIALLFQNQSFSHLENSFVSAAEMMQSYPLSIGAYFLLAAAGIIASLLCSRFAADKRRAAALAVLTALLLFAGIFTIRFAFYAMYMTVGL